jgi:hypothetical protein
LSNKIPTWDVLQKRAEKGPSIYMLCHEHEENVVQLLVGCHSPKEVWATLKKLLHGVGKWEGESLSKAFKNWVEDSTVRDFQAFPIVVG